MAASWVYVTIIISISLAILGAFSLSVAQRQLSSGELTVSVVGEVVCLPHKKTFFGLFGGAETQECTIGLYSKDHGSYYALNFLNSESVDVLADAEGSGRLFTVKGAIRIPSPPAYEGLDKYDVVGAIDVASAVASNEQGSYDEVVLEQRRVVEFTTRYNHTQIPDLHMIVKSTGKAYAGEEGSYCWENMCGDLVPIVPENTISLNKGDEIEFRIINYRQPEVFAVYVIVEDPALQPRCITDNLTGNVSCGIAPEGVQLPELTKVVDSNNANGNLFKYKVDMPAGTYIVTAGSSWLGKQGTVQSDASYHYKIEVR